MQLAPATPVAAARAAVPAPPRPGRVDGVFVPQFRSPGLPDGMPWGPENGNCGPASVVNALRLVGLDVPGFHGERSQAVLDAARVLVTGTNDPTAPTLKTEQADALRRAGAQVELTRSLTEGLRAVRAGAVLLVGGDRAAQGWPRRGDDLPSTRVANHASVVSRYVAASDRYVVFDPALERPVQVDARQLAAFTQVDGAATMLRLGIVVREPLRPAAAAA